jgi:hypothetical protein
LILADDAIAVKSGWNYYGRTFGRPTENVMVRNLSVGYSEGVAIGSEVAGGAKNITFQDIYVNGSMRAVYVKTEIGRGGRFVKKEGGGNSRHNATNFYKTPLCTLLVSQTCAFLKKQTRDFLKGGGRVPIEALSPKKIFFQTFF